MENVKIKKLIENVKNDSLIENVKIKKLMENVKNDSLKYKYNKATPNREGD